jgi:hypothetical protein
MAKLTSINCPKCAAPVHPRAGQSLVLCLYCGSALRLQPAAAETPSVEREVPPEALNELKQLMLAGRREDALRLAQALTGGAPEDATSVIGNLSQQITLSTVRRQTLTPAGLLMVALSAALLALGAAGLALGRLHPLLALALIAFAVFELSFFGPALAKTVRFLGARVAPATVLRNVPIGQAPLGGRPVHIMRLLLEVRPAGEPAFQAELMVPVREQSLHKAQAGASFEVRYQPDRPEEVVFHRAPKG